VSQLVTNVSVSVAASRRSAGETVGHSRHGAVTALTNTTQPAL